MMEYLFGGVSLTVVILAVLVSGVLMIQEWWKGRK